MADGLSTLSNNGSPTHTQRPSFHQVLTRLDAAMLRRLPIVLGWRDADSGEYLQSECRLLYFLDAGPIFSVFARDVMYIRRKRFSIH